LVLLPRICHYARFAFRHLAPEVKQEAIQSVVCGALAAYVRLVELGKADIAYAAPLAMYAIRQYHDGRRLGSRLNVLDVSSGYCQAKKGIVMERLDKFNREEEIWEEILIPDLHPRGTGGQPHRLPSLACHAEAARPQDRDEAGLG
jgi:hypothetical protein